LEGNVVDGLFCATLTGRRGGHIRTGRSGNVRRRCGGGWAGPRLFLGGSFRGVCVPVSGSKVRSLVGLSAHTAFHWWSAHCAAHMLLLSEKLMSCCAAGTNGCLDLRRRAAAPDGRVSAERSRCPGSMARCPRDSVATLRRSSAGWMPARIGRLSAGLGRRHPVTIRKASLMVGSIRRVWALRHQTGEQYSAVECTRARVAVRNVVAPAPQPEPASRLSSATRDVSFLRSLKLLAENCGQISLHAFITTSSYFDQRAQARFQQHYLPHKHEIGKASKENLQQTKWTLRNVTK